MSASPPSTLATGQLAGTQAPNQIEFLWERYRSLFWVVVLAIFATLGANYGIKYYKQRDIDREWSSFAAALDLDHAFAEGKQAIWMSDALVERLTKKDQASLAAALSSATEAQKPFLMLAMARKAMAEGQWDRAESTLAELERSFPKHSLVKTSDYPVQLRDAVKVDPDKPKPSASALPELKPTRPGSAVGLLREQISAARAYVAPSRFAQVPVPPEAKKVRFTLSTGGVFVIALMSEQAPRHAEEFLKLASENGGFWRGMAVDQIQRPTEFSGTPRAMHLGFESTREDDRSKWITTEPSKHALEFETNQLSHFPGAVSARVEADGKSSADRFWIVADDASRYDGERVVFGYVVEGLDAVKRVCDESMSAQEEQTGQGKPAANIRITEVTVL